MTKTKVKRDSSDVLNGWAAIAKFPGMSPAVAHRWAKAGMPIRREGRFTVADRTELQEWLGREAGMPKPAHVLTGDADIFTALKDSLAVSPRVRRNNPHASCHIAA
jgi:hypothetical protein